MTVSASLIAHTVVLDRLGKVEAFVAQYPQPSGGEVTPLAICYGKWRSQAFGQLVRIQSSCLYGEVLFSLECDCRKQLDEALAAIMAAGAGVVILLSQEGRGAGLVAKARGYEYSQRERVDSFTAYERLGYPVDARDYTAAAKMLGDLGLNTTWIKLMTNNPRKIEAVETAGFKVERVPSVTSSEPAAEAYLRSKRKRGHLL